MTRAFPNPLPTRLQPRRSWVSSFSTMVLETCRASQTPSGSSDTSSSGSPPRKTSKKRPLVLLAYYFILSYACGTEYRLVDTQILIFPGVGAFQTAIEHLHSRGLLEPLREYIRSGKPYFGICIGMQVLFESSTESPGTKGLEIGRASCRERV